MRPTHYTSVTLFTAATCATYLDGSGRKGGTTSNSPDLGIFHDTIDALQVLQDSYFEPWIGTWPSSIDWTAAVMGSYVSGGLDSLSQGLELIRLDPKEDYRVKENLISLYFSQVVSFYFGQEAFAIRNEAYDDILWVVLGWLDAIQFINLHNTMHYQTGSLGADPSQEISAMLLNESWHGNLWVPAFAHRARIFWDLASAGWDTKLCGGGMDWNPRLEPYKNAITNELFISASISMYLYFPGDDNMSPFKGGLRDNGPSPGAPEAKDWLSRDPKYLAAAIEGYKWLTTSGMNNSQGLFGDGFHISGYNNASSNNTKCDELNEMVYTYNQGVLLTGQLGLFQVTGMVSYLEDGHRLIQNVIAATGWDLERQRPVDNLTNLQPGQLPPWHGLGRGGVLEDACDVNGDCSQDSQTFKGIYMHHLTAFCAPLELVPGVEPSSLGEDDFNAAKLSHLVACQRYSDWLRHNAYAALSTRDSKGRFGMWWTVGLLNLTMNSLDIEPDAVPLCNSSVDYRTHGVPQDDIWMYPNPFTPIPEFGDDNELPILRPEPVPGQKVLGGRTKRSRQPGVQEFAETRRPAVRDADPNNRGRGRTVETQGGGLAVLRAFWEVSKQAFA